MDNEITTQRRKELAAALGFNDQYLYQCLTGRRDMGPIEAQRLERGSCGEISRRMVCQRTYAAIWPELADATLGGPHD